MLSDPEFEVLDAADPTQRERWIAAWQGWPTREVFAHPAYGELYARAGDRVLCAVQTGSGAGVIHPFILRDLAHEPFAVDLPGATDVVSPYGYGGPYAWGAAPREEASRSFWARLDEWAAGAGVVAEFIRFPLWEGLEASYPGEREEKLQNVVRSLDEELDTLWMDFEHKVRKNVNKARRSGLTVEVDTEGRRLEEFLAIYQDTMKRRDASAGYYFPREYFEGIRDRLPGQFCYFHAVVEGVVVSTELVLVSEENVYSFLGGTDERYFNQRPNDLLKYEIIAWAKGAGKRRFVLGGGYQPDDGIFRYKLAFAPRGALPFSVGSRILRPEAYEALVAARAAHAGAAWQPAPGYFPAYRG